jgi:outer membrane protein assembly factor BamB
MMMNENRIWMPVCLASLVAGATTAADWPQWQGLERDSVSRETGLLADWTQPPPQVWQVTTPGAGYNPPAVVGGVVYIAGTVGTGRARTGSLTALDAKTGSKKWECNYGPEWSENYEQARTTPTIADGRAYLISGMGRAVCVNVASGQMVWSVDLLERFKGKNIRWGISESPLLIGKIMICHPGGPDAAVAALDIESGKTVWTTKGLSEASAYCSPALLTIGGRKQLVTQTEDNVVGIDPGSGAVLWKHPHRNQCAVHANTPVAVGPDRVVVSSGYNFGTECLQITAAGAQRVWHVKGADNPFHGMLLTGTRLYTSGGGGLLYGLDPETGAVLFRVEGVKRASLIQTEVGIVAYDDSGKVLLVKPTADKAQVAGSFPVTFGKQQHWSSPVLADGFLYIRHGDGLAAYDLRASRGKVSGP